MDRLAQLVEQLWPGTGGELDFHDATGAVTLALYDAWRAGSWEEGLDLFHCLELARRRWRSEPQASILDHGYALAAACLAGWLVNEHAFDRALGYVRLGWEALDTKRQRRQELGLPPALSTEARIRLLGALGAGGWRCPQPGYAVDLLPFEQQVARFFEGSSAIRRHCSTHAEAADAAASPLLWTGMALALCALRYAPAHNKPLIAEINAWHMECWHGNLLPTGDDVTAFDPPPSPNRPLYWHYVIGHTWLAHLNAPAPDALALAARLGQLYDSLVESQPDPADPAASNRTYLAGIGRDRSWMLGTLRQQGLTLL